MFHPCPVVEAWELGALKVYPSRQIGHFPRQLDSLQTKFDSFRRSFSLFFSTRLPHRNDSLAG